MTMQMTDSSENFENLDVPAVITLEKEPEVEVPVKLRVIRGQIRVDENIHSGKVIVVTALTLRTDTIISHGCESDKFYFEITVQRFMNYKIELEIGWSSDEVTKPVDRTVGKKGSFVTKFEIASTDTDPESPEHATLGSLINWDTGTISFTRNGILEEKELTIPDSWTKPLFPTLITKTSIHAASEKMLSATCRFERPFTFDLSSVAGRGIAGGSIRK
jgi:hypothetical protein